ncbi:hypothetical protein KIPB_005634, partial [Kipferlia bialata]
GECHCGQTNPNRQCECITNECIYDFAMGGCYGFCSGNHRCTEDYHEHCYCAAEH